MNEHLLKAGADVTPREGDEMTRLPFLKTWFRTRNAMVLYLSNGTLQVSISFERYSHEITGTGLDGDASLNAKWVLDPS